MINLHIDPSNGRIIIDTNGNGGEGNTASTSTPDNGGFSSAAAAPPPPQKKAPKQPKPFSVPDKEFTAEEVAQHNKPGDCWCIIKNVVLDLTPFWVITLVVRINCQFCWKRCY